MQSDSIIIRNNSRPNTKKVEFGHEQLDQHSPNGYREKIIGEVSSWKGVSIGQSQVSEPSSVGFHLITSNGPENGFLYKGTIEFAHIHTTGFLHISMPLSIAQEVVDKGWGEFHPVSKRPDFYDNILMLYAPTNDDELEYVIKLIHISYEYAIGK